MAGIGKLSSARRCGASDAIEPVLMPRITSIISALTSGSSSGRNIHGASPQIVALTTSALL